MAVLSQPTMKWRTDPRTASKWDQAPYESPSPNLLALSADLKQRFGGGNMGIHWDRPTSSGFRSEHSWGASLDHGTLPAQVDWLRSVNVPTGRATSLAEHHAMCDWVVAHSAELQIDAIVSIGRSWKSDRVHNGAGGWMVYDSGYTGHSHFVTTFEGWHNATPIADRLAPRPTPIIEPSEEDDMTQSFMWRHADYKTIRPGLFWVCNGSVCHLDGRLRDALLGAGVRIITSSNDGVYDSMLHAINRPDGV